jgi:hypothetical protein
MEIANTLVDDFNFISLIYQLIGYNLTLTFNELCIKDAYTFIVESTSKYDSHHFYKVIIDISTSKYSITRLEQF